jgi:hypothetical protein
MAVEAMVNEIEQVAKFTDQFGGGGLEGTISSLLSQAEDEHVSFEMKLEIAVVGFTGKLLERNAPAMKETNLLFRIRNALVHLKGEYVDHSTPEPELLTRSKKIVRDLVGRGILDQACIKRGDHWLDTIANERVAVWASTVPDKFADHLIAAFPEDTWFRMFLAQGWQGPYAFPEDET